MWAFNVSVHLNTFLTFYFLDSNFVGSKPLIKDFFTQFRKSNESIPLDH